VELVSQVVEEMSTTSNGVQEGVQVELVPQVVEEMPGMSDGVQVGSVERDVAEGSQGSMASVEEDQEKDMAISFDMIAAGEYSYLQFRGGKWVPGSDFWEICQIGRFLSC
jgi:hypothetical protein